MEYSNFSLEILEYCDKSILLKREQYYFNLLNPPYNILKIAGSSLGHKLTEETKNKIRAKQAKQAKAALFLCFPFRRSRKKFTFTKKDEG